MAESSHPSIVSSRCSYLDRAKTTGRFRANVASATTMLVRFLHARLADAAQTQAVQALTGFDGNLRASTTTGVHITPLRAWAGRLAVAIAR